MSYSVGGRGCGNGSIHQNIGCRCFWYEEWKICLAVLSVPVFDTLRVMSMRMIRGTSPFNPDKTHLHHLFIDLGFSHIGTTFSILSLNTLVVLAWLVSFLLGASVDVQLYVVLFFSILITFVFYRFTRQQIRNNTKVYRMLNKISKHTHIERKNFWKKLEIFIDRFWFWPTAI